MMQTYLILLTKWMFLQPKRLNLYLLKCKILVSYLFLFEWFWVFTVIESTVMGSLFCRWNKGTFRSMYSTRWISYAGRWTNITLIETTLKIIYILLGFLFFFKKLFIKIILSYITFRIITTSNKIYKQKMSFFFVAVALNKSSFTNYMPHLTILETNSSLLFSSYSTRVFGATIWLISLKILQNMIIRNMSWWVCG